jgi:hypothetical protein
MSTLAPPEPGQSQIAYETPIGAEVFVVQAGPIPEGHERLTREAAAGLRGLTADDLAALREGVRRPDTAKLTDHIHPAQQRRHALRRDLCQPLADSLGDMRNQLVLLHARALASMVRGARREALQWLGEALHLLQDSYAPAHVERIAGAGGRYPITYVRYYGIIGEGYPREHRFPFDTRDLVSGWLGGALHPWARAAVRASREFLRMALDQLARPRSPRNRVELRHFLERHLALAARRTEPRGVYPLRCRVAPRLPIRL